MSLPAWREEPILKSAKGAARTNVLYNEHFAPHSVLRVFLKRHDRESFNCGDPAMNDFLQRYVRQSHESGAAKTFLAIDQTDDRTILGFYSLAPGSLAYADTPEIVRRGLARHDVPGFRLARIATDLRGRGQGFGGGLLACAARRCLRAAAEVGGVVLIIDAKNDRAAR